MPLFIGFYADLRLDDYLAFFGVYLDKLRRFADLACRSYLHQEGPTASFESASGRDRTQERIIVAENGRPFASSDELGKLVSEWRDSLGFAMSSASTTREGRR